MWFTDQYFNYAKRFIDTTYEQRKIILSNPHATASQIERVKVGTLTYCYGYILALTQFQILSEEAYKVLEEYILKKDKE
jgi:hypothetical protein